LDCLHRRRIRTSSRTHRGAVRKERSNKKISKKKSNKKKCKKLKKEPYFKKAKCGGFYLQPLLALNIKRKPKENYEITKQKALKKIGYSTSDKETLSKVDSTYMDSCMISGLKTKKDGEFYQYSKIFTQKEEETLLQLVENILEKNIEKILNGDFSKDNPIIDYRLEYFKRQGINFPKKYFMDNMDEILNKYKGILPSSEVTKRITEIREKYEMSYIKEAALNRVLEGDVSSLDAGDMDEMFNIDTGGYHMSEYDGDGAKSFVFVNPLHSYHGEELDHLIDHEIRHIIEFNYLVHGNTIEYKVGNAVSRIDEDGLTNKQFTEFNEAYTDILSVQACEKRWRKGQYIFAPKVYLAERFGNDFTSDGYSDWFYNLEKIISGCEDIMNEMRMDYTNSRFYKLLSFEEWQIVNDLISGEGVSEELEKFGAKIKRKLKR